MSKKRNNGKPLESTLNLIETDPEVKSFIYQQISEFAPYVTPETLVVVLARDPLAQQEEKEVSADDFRIAIVLKEQDASIEAEAYSPNIFDAIRLAKESMISRLSEIKNKVENSKDRLKAIKDAGNNSQVH